MRTFSYKTELNRKVPLKLLFLELGWSAEIHFFVMTSLQRSISQAISRSERREIGTHCSYHKSYMAHWELEEDPCIANSRFAYDVTKSTGAALGINHNEAMTQPENTGDSYHFVNERGEMRGKKRRRKKTQHQMRSVHRGAEFKPGNESGFPNISVFSKSRSLWIEVACRRFRHSRWNVSALMVIQIVFLGFILENDNFLLSRFSKTCTCNWQPQKS